MGRQGPNHRIKGVSPPRQAGRTEKSEFFVVAKKPGRPQPRRSEGRALGSTRTQTALKNSMSDSNSIACRGRRDGSGIVEANAMNGLRRAGCVMWRSWLCGFEA